MTPFAEWLAREMAARGYQPDNRSQWATYRRVATEPVPGCEPVAVLSRADDAGRMAAALCADEERTRPPHSIARATYHVAPVAFIPSTPAGERAQGALRRVHSR